MPETKRDFYNVCPSCWTVRIKRRVFKSPKYLCEVCGETFQQKKRISDYQRKLFNNTLKETRIVADKMVGHLNPRMPESRIRQLVVYVIKRDTHA